MNSIEPIFFGVISLAGIAVAYSGYELGLTQFGKPGAGLFPFILGIALPLLCIPLLIRWFRVRAINAPLPLAEGTHRPWHVETAIYAALIVYVLALPYLGFTVCSLLLVFFLVRFTAGKSSMTSLMLSVALVAPLVLILGKALKVGLPEASLF